MELFHDVAKNGVSSIVEKFHTVLMVIIQLENEIKILNKITKYEM